MKHKYTWLFVLAVAVISIVSCKKDDDFVHARIVDTGDITYEGCGYVLKLDDSALLKPVYLPSAYQHDQLEVRVKYKHTGLLDTCQYGSVIYDMVNVSDIERADP